MRLRSILFLCLATACNSTLQPTDKVPPHSIPAVAGTGGVYATGGAVGTGGMAAAGGTSGGGQGGAGTGGSGPDAGTCESLSAAYQVALTAARICNDDVSGQCGQVAVPGLPVSGCPNGCGTIWVNDLTPLTAVRMQWLEAGCQGPGACRQASCPLLVPAGQCVPGDGGQALCQTLATD